MRPAVQQLVATLQKRGLEPHGLPIDAWIDSSNLIRRIQLTLQLSRCSGSQTANVAIKIDYLAYGQQPAPTIPPAAQTLDLLKLLGKA